MVLGVNMVNIQHENFKKNYYIFNNIGNCHCFSDNSKALCWKTLSKKIFTWWNQYTLGTKIKTLFFGKFVGKDHLGNKYYESKKGKRWVIYNGEINASKIESDWYQWMHYQIDTNPSKVKVSKHSWQRPHSDNKTGTELSLIHI